MVESNDTRLRLSTHSNIIVMVDVSLMVFHKGLHL